MIVCSRCYQFLLKSTTTKSKETVGYILHLHYSNWSRNLAPNLGGWSFIRGSTLKINQTRDGSAPGVPAGLLHRGMRTWADETHYSVLGVSHDASQAQIRNAYLRLSKELHPDHNIGKDESETERIHQKFVKINAAYSVIGNKKQRRLYDLEVLMHEDPRWKDQENIRTNNPHMFRTRPMSFEERAQSIGLNKQDPNFYAKHGNYHQKVVLWCVVFIAVGVLVQGSAIMALYKRHAAQLDLATNNNTALLVQARANARNYTTIQEQWDALNLTPKDVNATKIEEAKGRPVLEEEDMKTA